VAGWILHGRNLSSPNLQGRFCNLSLQNQACRVWLKFPPCNIHPATGIPKANISVFSFFLEFLSVFPSWVAKTQFNHWTKRVLNTRLSTTQETVLEPTERAASGGALTPQPPRATRRQPESISVKIRFFNLKIRIEPVNKKEKEKKKGKKGKKGEGGERGPLRLPRAHF